METFGKEPKDINFKRHKKVPVTYQHFSNKICYYKLQKDRSNFLIQITCFFSFPLFFLLPLSYFQGYQFNCLSGWNHSTHYSPFEKTNVKNKILKFCFNWQKFAKKKKRNLVFFEASNKDIKCSLSWFLELSMS